MSTPAVDAATYAYAALSGLGTPQPPPAPKGGKNQKKKGGRERPQAVREVIHVVDGDENARFGDRQRIQSRQRNTKEWTSVKSLSASSKDKKVWIRGSIHATRKKSNKMAFVLLRQQIYSIQALVVANETVTPENPIEIPRTMVKYVDKIPRESIVDIYGKVVLPKEPVKSATQQDVEILVEKILVVSASLPELPFQIDDAARRGADVDDESGNAPAEGEDEKNRQVACKISNDKPVFRVGGGFIGFDKFLELHASEELEKLLTYDTDERTGEPRFLQAQQVRQTMEASGALDEMRERAAQSNSQAARDTRGDGGYSSFGGFGGARAHTRSASERRRMQN